MDYWGKTWMFMSSYLVLFIGLLLAEVSNLLSVGEPMVNYLRTHPATTISIVLLLASVVVSIFAVIAFHTTYRTSNGNRQTSITVQSVSHGSNEVIGYLLTMILPFLGKKTLSEIFTVSNGWLDLALLILTVLVVATLYINSSLIVVNPTLLLTGIAIYKISYKRTKDAQTASEGILLTPREYNEEKIEGTVIADKIDKSVYILTH